MIINFFDREIHFLKLETCDVSPNNLVREVIVFRIRVIGRSRFAGMTSTAALLSSVASVVCKRSAECWA